MEGSLRGTVRLLFQPAEEGKGGAKVMIEEGALDGVSAAFGLHVMPFAPTGIVALRVGGWRCARQQWVCKRLDMGQAGFAGCSSRVSGCVICRMRLESALHRCARCGCILILFSIIKFCFP